MNRRIKIAILEGTLFGIFIWALLTFAFGSLVGIVCGILLGTIFGLIMESFTQRQANKFETIRSEIQKRENVLFDDQAYHFMGSESVGGWLFLTDKSLIFISHKYNVQRHAMEIPLENIKEISKNKSLNIVQTSVIITTKGGKETKLVLAQRNKWMKLITENIQLAKTEKVAS